MKYLFQIFITGAIRLNQIGYLIMGTNLEELKENPQSYKVEHYDTEFFFGK
jgi:hypothetical protein